MKNLYKIENEVYIVSNTENVNENCWIIVDDRLVQVSYLLSDEVARGNKVILTTNKLLIKDGVQAIDDEFLEWFVKNPNCEEIEVVDVRSLGVYGSYYPYKINIPKKETKQETLEEAKVNNLIKLFGKDFDLEPSSEMKNCNESFMAGAKWQQEQIKNMYSEEEVRKMFSKYNEVIAHRDIEEWQPWIDKQFKKNKWKKY